MKIGIVGSGFVGATAAYAMVMQGIGREIVMVDRNSARAQAEADDILHAVPFSHQLQVSSGEYAELAGCKVVIIAAGVSQKPGESRLELLQRNAAVFRDVIPSVLSHATDAVLLIATNPVDIMTHLAAQYAAEQGVPPHRVLGSGTMLDTARFRALLGLHLGVDSSHVHSYVVGEHGDSEVLTWSLVSIGGIPLREFCAIQHIELGEQVMEDIDTRVRRAAYNIIAGKGATYYGIGSALARIVNVIIRGQQSILTVCTPMSEVAGVEDVTVSLPHIVEGKGIVATLPLPLNDIEQGLLYESARVVRSAIDELEHEKAPQYSH